MCSGSQSTVLCVSEHRALCLRAPCSVSQSTVLCVSEHRALVLRAPCSGSQSTVLCVSEHRALCLRAPCSVSQSTVLCVSEHRALCLRAPCSGSQRTVLWFSVKCAPILSHPSYPKYPILVQADPLIKWALDKYFKDHNQRGRGKWRMYHTDETRFYETEDSKVTGRLLKENSKLTFVDV